MKKFTIKVFGTLSITGPNGQHIPLAGSKQQALLSYLALNPENPPSRDRVMALLWGDRFNDQARQSLRQGLLKLRQAFEVDGHSIIQTDNNRLGLDLDNVTVDVSEFIKLAATNTPETDKEAVAIFQGTLLDGLNLRENDFEDWLSLERSRVNDIAIPVFERLAAHHLKSAEQENSQHIARQLVTIDPLREASHRLLMTVLAQSGQRASAIKQYNVCAELLKQELDVNPDSETEQLLAEIKSPGPLPAQPNEPLPVGAKPSTKVSVTVLPFHQMGDGDTVSALADGLTEDIVTALTRFRWLDVIVQLPVENDNPTVPTLREAAVEKAVLYSVEGSVRQLGEQVRITAQLVDLETGTYMWVDRYDRSTTDLFSLQDDITKTIAASLESEIVAAEGGKARKKFGDALSAWDCYHLGLSVQYEFSAPGNEKAQSLFRRAIDLDPMFAAAYARLSYAMVLSTIYFEANQNSGLLDEALELAQKATRYDDQDAIARFSLGRVYLARGDYEQSIVELEHAISLNPSLAQAHCGLGDSLAYSGRAEEAIEKFEVAVQLSPHDPHRWAFSMYGAMACILSGDYERAVEWAQSSIRVPNSHFWANVALVSALGHLEKTAEAKQALKALIEIKPDISCNYVRERLFYLRDETQVAHYIKGLEKAGCM